MFGKQSAIHDIICAPEAEMLKTGLVSVTFRKLSCEEVIEITQNAGLDAIEWGGDVHVPHGDIERAAVVADETNNAGLSVSSYGSYYRPGKKVQDIDFQDVLATAKVLKAPVIRVWAGDSGSSTANKATWDVVVKESRRIADMAAVEEIRIAYEFHGNSLTDTNESAARLLEEVNHHNIGIYWQPPGRTSLQNNLEGLRAVKPHLENIHAFSWDEETGERLPLLAMKEKWIELLKEIASAQGDRYILLEFVKDDSIENFFSDAETLKGWIQTTT